VAQTHNLSFEASTLPITPVIWFGKLESDLYIVCVFYDDMYIVVII